MGVFVHAYTNDIEQIRLNASTVEDMSTHFSTAEEAEQQGIPSARKAL